MTDLLDRLRAADPVSEPPVAPPVEWMVARLEAAARAAAPHGTATTGPAEPFADTPPTGLVPSAPAARRAPLAPRRPRARVLVPVFAAALAVALVVLLGRGSSPDVVAQARAALGAPNEIIHTVQRTERFDGEGKKRSTGNYMNLGEMSDRSEQWAALNPLRIRTVMTVLPRDRGAPLTLDHDYANGVDRGANSWDDKLRVYTMPPELVADYEASNTGKGTGLSAGVDPVAGLRALLADGKLVPAGETEVGDRRVLRLRGGRPERQRGRAVELAVEVEYLVDAETYAPVQVTYRVHPASGFGQTGLETTRITFETYERLPLAGNEALLRIPDANQRRVVKTPGR